MIEIVLVAAVADNGVIGDGTAMPWRLSADLRRFRALTMGRPVIMGRKTFQSIGRPLAGRTTIVVSRDPALALAGAVVAPSVEAALAVARADALRRGGAEIMVAGGGEIYRALMPRADRLEITRVHAAPAGRTTFPAIEPGRWQALERGQAPAGPEDSAAATFLTYRRLAG